MAGEHVRLARQRHDSGTTYLRDSKRTFLRLRWVQEAPFFAEDSGAYVTVSAKAH